MHPSWRDLVIEALAADAGRAARFLERCSVDGLLLALSTGGGAAGERSLPLLVEDADWDALADRMHDVLRHGLDEDVVRLLDVLETALAAPLGERAEAEVVALAEHALDMAGRRLDELAPPAPIDLLVGWLELGSAVGQAVVHPAVVAAWIELVPTAGTDLDDPEERRGNEAWARLARSLRVHSYETFERLGGDELMVLTFSQGSAAYPSLLEDVVGQALAGQVSVSAAGEALPPEIVAGMRLDAGDGLGPAEFELVQRVLRDLTPRREGGDATGGRPERPRPSPPATPPAAGPAGRGSAERAPSRRPPASRLRVRRRPPGPPPAR